MRADRLSNCKICGRLFLKEHTDCCLECYKKIEQEYTHVMNFLAIEKNHLASIEEVSEETGVSVKQIVDFIREGRIFAEDFPKLGYKCAHCEKLIKRHVLCDECFHQFSSNINQTILRETLEKKMKK